MAGHTKYRVATFAVDDVNWAIQTSIAELFFPVVLNFLQSTEIVLEAKLEGTASEYTIPSNTADQGQSLVIFHEVNQ